jgi:RNA polymerase sigma-70 factor (ECF subfamily)
VARSSVRLLRLQGSSDPAPADAARSTAAEGPSDAELVRLARTRDPRAAAQIWDRYSSRVRNILHRTLGPTTDLDDLVQETFVGLFRNLGSLRDADALAPFLFGIAVRVARSSLRKKRVRRWLMLTPDGSVPDAPSSAHDPGARAAFQRLHVVLGELADRDRIAFVLRYGESYELTEIAAMLGCSLATTKRCIARAEEYVLARAREEALLRPYVEYADRNEEVLDATP